MQIKNMTKTKNPEFKTKAFFDIETKNFYIHGCRLVMGYAGRLVVHMPFKEFMNQGIKRYDPVIEVKDVDYLEAIGQEAVKVYEKIR